MKIVTANTIILKPGAVVLGFHDDVKKQQCYLSTIGGYPVRSQSAFERWRQIWKYVFENNIHKLSKFLFILKV